MIERRVSCTYCVRNVKTECNYDETKDTIVYSS